MSPSFIAVVVAAILTSLLVAWKIVELLGEQRREQSHAFITYMDTAQRGHLQQLGTMTAIWNGVIEQLRDDHRRSLESIQAGHKANTELLLNLKTFGDPSGVRPGQRVPAPLDAEARAARMIDAHIVQAGVARLRVEYEGAGMKKSDAELEEEVRGMLGQFQSE